MGDAVNQAQRLQTASQPDTILTTSRVLERAGDAFKREKLCRLELKGIGEVTTYRVTGVEQQRVQLRGAFRHLSPLTGRETELEQAVAQIVAWLETSYPPETWDITQLNTPLQGRNRLLILQGVPAVGKSRLAYEIAERLKDGVAGNLADQQQAWVATPEPAAVATAHCGDSGALAHFTAELARVAGLTAENLPQRWEMLCANAAQAVSPEYAERQQQQLRLLAYVLGCDKCDTGAYGQTDPQSFAKSCQLAIRACCELVAHETTRGPGVAAGRQESRVVTSAPPGNRPIILIIEDLQWLGSFKDVLADVLARACLPRPLVIIGTARPEYSHDPGSLEEGECCIIELGTLSRLQGDALVQALLPGLALPPAVSDELYEKAAGIPYYYEDFARMLVREGLVVSVPGVGGRESWRLARDIAELEVPEDLQALMLGRLDQLDSEPRELARRASVLGASFRRDVLLEIESRLAVVSSDQSEQALQALVKEKILCGDNERCSFEHALMQQAAYCSLLSANRRILHSTAADVIAARIVPGALSEVQLSPALAEHLRRAGRYCEEHRACCQVLVTLTQAKRTEEWNKWEEQARRSLSNCVGQIPGAPQTSAALCLAQGQWRLRRGDYQEAAGLYQQALQLAEVATDELMQSKALVGHAILNRIGGNFVQAQEQLERALELALDCENETAVCAALNNMGLLAYYAGDYKRARRYYSQGLAKARTIGNRRAETSCMLYLGALENEIGHHREAYEMYVQAKDLAQSLEDRILECSAISNMGSALHKQGQLDLALINYNKAMELNRYYGQRNELAYTLSNLGQLAFEKGEFSLAFSRYNEAREYFNTLHETTEECRTLAELGKVTALLDMVEISLSFLKEAERLSPFGPGIENRVRVSCAWVYYYSKAGQRQIAMQALGLAQSLAADGGILVGSTLSAEIVRAEALLRAAAPSA